MLSLCHCGTQIGVIGPGLRIHTQPALSSPCHESTLAEDLLLLTIYNLPELQQPPHSHSFYLSLTNGHEFTHLQRKAHFYLIQSSLVPRGMAHIPVITAIKHGVISMSMMSATTTSIRSSSLLTSSSLSRPQEPFIVQVSRIASLVPLQACWAFTPSVSSALLKVRLYLVHAQTWGFYEN